MQAACEPGAAAWRGGSLMLMPCGAITMASYWDWIRQQVLGGPLKWSE